MSSTLVKINLESKIVNLDQIISPAPSKLVKILNAKEDSKIQELDDSSIRSFILEQLTEEATETLSMSLEGEISEKNGQIELSYYQYSDDGLEKTLNRIVFSKIDPNLVTVLRSGELSSRMTFNNKAKFVKALYKLPFGKIDMNIYTKLLDNQLSNEGGSIRIHYVLEVVNGTMQYCELELKTRII